jgi:hypothetical protein
MANAPLPEQDGIRYSVICDFGKAEYFFKMRLTRRLQNSLTGKSVERYGYQDFRGRSAYSRFVPALSRDPCRTIFIERI